MAHAILMLSDNGSTVAMHVEFSGADGKPAPFDIKSPAHQHMQLLIKAMDQIAARVPDAEPLPTAITVARLADNIAASERKALADGTAQRMIPEA